MAEYMAADPTSAWWNSIQEIMVKIEEGDTLVVHDPAQAHFAHERLKERGLVGKVKLHNLDPTYARVQGGTPVDAKEAARQLYARLTAVAHAHSFKTGEDLRREREA